MVVGDTYRIGVVLPKEPCAQCLGLGVVSAGCCGETKPCPACSEA